VTVVAERIARDSGVRDSLKEGSSADVRYNQLDPGYMVADSSDDYSLVHNPLK
jgi:hypothetical protein